MQGAMRLPSVAVRHFRIGLNLKEGFRIAELGTTQMESISRKRREARKGGIETHRQLI
jgi:hypothetical protein